MLFDALNREKVLQIKPRSLAFLMTESHPPTQYNRGREVGLAPALWDRAIDSIAVRRIA
jgi:hypothetical protein